MLWMTVWCQCGIYGTNAQGEREVNTAVNLRKMMIILWHEKTCMWKKSSRSCIGQTRNFWAGDDWWIKHIIFISDKLVVMVSNHLIEFIDYINRLGSITISQCRCLLCSTCYLLPLGKFRLIFFFLNFFCIS